jgi:peptidyl-prolyl cis-trans isomerase C
MGWLVFLLAGSLAVSQGTAEAPPAAGQVSEEGGVVATVNGQPIYFEDIEKYLGDLHTGMTETRRGSFDLDALMARLVNDALLAQEARTLGMQNEGDIPKQVEDLRLNLAVNRLDREEVADRAQPTEEEIRQAYEKEYATVSFRMLTTHERDEAEEILVRLRDGEDFEALVKEHSKDQYAGRGGLVKSLPRIDIPEEIADAVFAMKPGEIGGPLRTRIGWAAIRVEEFGEPAPEDFDKRKRKLQQILALHKTEALRADLARRLRKTHKVSVDREAVDVIGCEPLPDGRLEPQMDDPGAILVRVDDRTIEAEVLANALRRRWKGVRNQEAALAAKPIVLDRLIQNQMMIAEALRRGYGDTPEVKRQVRAFETRQLVPRYLQEVVAADIEVTKEEARAYYDEHPEYYRKPPRVHVGQITVKTREEAERLAELLRQGTDLAWLARQHSIDGFKDAGGDRGWVVPGQSGSLPEGMGDAKPGDVLGPVGPEGNVVIMRVTAKEDQGLYPFEEVSGEARAAVFTGKFEKVLHEFMQTLVSRSEIHINEEVLRSLSITGTREEMQESGHGHGH